MSTSASPSKAEIMIDTLDRAGDYLDIARNASKSDKDVEELDQAHVQLATTRSLLVKINTEARFQIDNIRDGLPAVAKVLEKLVNELDGGTPHSMRRVKNAIEDLGGETKKIQSLLPGLWIEAIENAQRKGSKSMINGPVVKELEKGQLDGGTFIAKRNVAEGECMINSLVQTDTIF